MFVREVRIKGDHNKGGEGFRIGREGPIPSLGSQALWGRFHQATQGLIVKKSLVEGRRGCEERDSMPEKRVGDGGVLRNWE